jgi:hypothetical protein
MKMYLSSCIISILDEVVPHPKCTSAAKGVAALNPRHALHDPARGFEVNISKVQY